tara:strand:- start:2147 stop:2404 length:258 start_codon:yes stop_codon:yes gene_type:complete
MSAWGWRSHFPRVSDRHALGDETAHSVGSVERSGIERGSRGTCEDAMFGLLTVKVELRLDVAANLTLRACSMQTVIGREVLSHPL